MKSQKKRLHTENSVPPDHPPSRNCCSVVLRIVLRCVRYAPGLMWTNKQCFEERVHHVLFSNANKKDSHTTGKRAPQMRIKEKDKMSPIFEDMFSYSKRFQGKGKRRMRATYVRMRGDVREYKRRSFQHSHQREAKRPRCVERGRADSADVRS